MWFRGLLIRFYWRCFVVVASKPCLDMSEVAWLDQLFAEARIGGIRFTQNANVSSTIENITNWDIQSTVFLALQVMGSVGKSTSR